MPVTVTFLSVTVSFFPVAVSFFSVSVTLLTMPMAVPLITVKECMRIEHDPVN